MFLDLAWRAYHIHHKDTFFCRIYVKRDSNDRIIGWALLEDLLYRMDGFKSLQLFVHEEHRGKGVGSRLMSMVAKDNVDAKISVWASSSNNTALFKKFNYPPFHVFDMIEYEKTGECKLYKF